MGHREPSAIDTVFQGPRSASPWLSHAFWQAFLLLSDLSSFSEKESSSTPLFPHPASPLTNPPLPPPGNRGFHTGVKLPKRERNGLWSAEAEGRVCPKTACPEVWVPVCQWTTTVLESSGGLFPTGSPQTFLRVFLLGPSKTLSWLRPGKSKLELEGWGGWMVGG